MPPKPKTKEMIAADRRKIVAACFEIMDNSNDFEGISMRQIATKLGVSATYIYRYFENKDELYLCILSQGFAMLFDDISAAVNKYNDPLQRYESSLVAFTDFALDRYAYFYLMYGSRHLKCSEYIGTRSEESALRKSEIAFKTRTLMLGLIHDCLPKTSENECLVLLAQIRSSLCGTIHLYKSNYMDEIGVEFGAVLRSVFEELSLMMVRRMPEEQTLDQARSTIVNLENYSYLIRHQNS